jgi:hypothetical protein
VSTKRRDKPLWLHGGRRLEVVWCGVVCCVTCVVRHRMKGLGSKKASLWSRIRSFVT